MKISMYAALAIVLLLVLAPVTDSLAGEVDVVAVKTSSGENGIWSFSVTARHDDEGWGHYADRWEVLGPGGEVIGTRVLLHPHVGEQPFTRSLEGVKVSEGVSEVVVRAHDLVHGYGGEEMEVKLMRE
ncbi:hypothetical protein MUP29_13950 [bacterium]|nr:hypothetical protein [bacterium]